MAKARLITGLDAQASTTRNVHLILRQRLDEMYAYAPYVESADNIHELHNLRIAAKRVRYTLELFEDILPESSQGFAEELARLQDELGALHDSEVMLALLRQLLSVENPRGDSSELASSEGPSQAELLAPEMASTLFQPTHASTLSGRERQGLVSFLHRQELRREQSYALFFLHWQELEQRQFRSAILEMAKSNW